MLHFDSDYMEGAHPLILESLSKTNFEHLPGYGSDKYCISAKDKIKKAIKNDSADVHFLVGGTQTNATVLKYILKNYEGVLAAQTGHISVHEAGAIEAGGHKVLTLPQKNGKISAENVENYFAQFFADSNFEHMVRPGAVYISHPTEYGTLYTLSELEALNAVCKNRNVPLFLDGARLGYGLAAEEADVTLPDIARLCDVFYIGGTKVGALFGEAVVFKNSALCPGFFTFIKQQGALLAKGWLLGLQFDTLFTSDLYMKISKNAVQNALKIKKALVNKGYELYIDSPTNQQFVRVTNEQLKKISKFATSGFWEKTDENHTVIRFATSWATNESDIESLIAKL